MSVKNCDCKRMICLEIMPSMNCCIRSCPGTQLWIYTGGKGVAKFEHGATSSPFDVVNMDVYNCGFYARVIQPVVKLGCQGAEGVNAARYLAM